MKFFTPGERGVIHVLLIILILLIGIVATVYLTKTPQIFKSKASSNSLNERITVLNNQITQTVNPSGFESIFNMFTSGDKTEELVSLTKERKALLLTNIEKSPEEVLKNRLPEETINLLPEKAKQNIEKQTVVSGTVTRLHFDNFKDKKSTDKYTLNSGTVTYNLKPVKGPVILDNRTLEVSGVVLDNYLIAEGNNLKGEAVTSQNQVSSANIAVIPVRFNNSGTSRFTKTYLDDVFFNNPFSVKNFYHENSYTKLSITGKVFEYVQIPFANDFSENGDCANLTFAAKVDEILGNQLDGYKYKVYMFNDMAPGCPQGWALIGGELSFINGPTDVSILAHEFGHNLGLDHANAILCKDNKPIDVYGNCTLVEYGDIMDVMGSSARLTHTNPFNKKMLGWLSDQAFKQVTGDGIFTLNIQEKNPDNLKALIIPASGLDYSGTGEPSFYYVSYRGKYGFDTQLGDQYLSGVSIHLISSTNRTYMIYPMLKDNSGGYSYRFPILEDGKEFIDPLSRIKISQLSHNDTTAVVKIDLYSIEDKYGSNLRAFLANTNLDPSTQVQLIIIAQSDIADQLRRIGINIRSNISISDGRLITADTVVSAIPQIADLDKVRSIDLPTPGGLTSVAKCNVSWLGLNSSYPVDQKFDAKINIDSTKVGTGYVSVYLDGKRVSGGEILQDNKLFSWNINPENEGKHKLEFVINDWEGYGIVGQDPSARAICAPSFEFTTYNPSTVPSAKCNVIWSNIATSYSPNIKFETNIKIANSEVGRGYISVYLDGKPVSGGEIVKDQEEFSWEINSGEKGNHTLSFLINDWDRYEIKDGNPELRQVCSPEFKFITK